MSDASTTPIQEWFLANVKKANFKEVDFDNGMKMLRMTIQEGSRITILDIHAQAAKEMGEIMIKWAADNAQPDDA